MENPTQISTKIKIQTKELRNKRLPYPYFITLPHGDVGRQDFWRGTPYKLLGFTTVDRPCEVLIKIDSLNDHMDALNDLRGLVCVFERDNEEIYTDINPIESIIEVKS